MKCSFCSKSFSYGGKMFVKTNGEVFYFESSKCEKNFKMGRNPKKAKWSRGLKS